MREKIKKVKQIYETSEEYRTVREEQKMQHPHLICVTGSIAYGTDRPDSDIDIRGIVGVEKDIACGLSRDWETTVFSETDTVMYSYKKAFAMLMKGNPDALALIGQDPGDYLYLSELGRQLVEDHTMFLGAKAVYDSFIGYSDSQMKRLQLAELGQLEGNKRLIREKKESILGNAIYNMHTKYGTVQANGIKATFQVPEEPGEKIQITDFSCQNVSMDDFFDVAKDLKNITSSFGKKGKRNEKKSDFKLNKHCMHTVRGILTGIECLETGKVQIYRQNDLPLLKSILNGDFMGSDVRMLPEFYELVEDLRRAALYAYEHTVLPQEPDTKRLADLMSEFVLEDLKKRHPGNCKEMSRC